VLQTKSSWNIITDLLFLLDQALFAFIFGSLTSAFNKIITADAWIRILFQEINKYRNPLFGNFWKVDDR
jgi:hypothetical protein